MQLTNKQKQFIRDHAFDDISKLLLGAGKYPDLNIPFLVEQIASRKQIREKLPSWYENEDLVFPAKIAAEQCSSEQTAMYKQRLVSAEDLICDLTGGLGIDSFFFSKKVKELTYIERFPVYCEVARHNFQALGASNITVINENSTDILSMLLEVDAFYIDPARRGEGNKRVYALSDCEPDLSLILPDLFKKSPRVIAKLSPMADIQQTLSLLPGTVAVHVLSVKNECKELIFDIRRDAGSVKSPQIHCVGFTSSGEEQSFDFTLSDEHDASSVLTANVKNYLYEPNASIMKAGAFKSIALRYQLEKFHVSSQLYTSSSLVTDFPGRKFRVEEYFPFSGKLCKTLAKEYPKANITVRNFPLSVEELRKRTKIKDGGDVYLFATTLANSEKVIIRCSRV